MRIHKSALAAAMAATTNDVTRYFRNAVQIAPAPDGGWHIDGTNGAIAVRVTTPGEPEADGVPELTGPILVPKTALTTALKAAVRGKNGPPEQEYVTVSTTPTGAVLDAAGKNGAVAVPFTPPEANFPNLDRVMIAPAEDDLILGLTAEMLETLAAVTRALAVGQREPNLTIRIPARSIWQGHVESTLAATVTGANGTAEIAFMPTSAT